MLRRFVDFLDPCELRQTKVAFDMISTRLRARGYQPDARTLAMRVAGEIKNGRAADEVMAGVMRDVAAMRGI